MATILVIEDDAALRRLVLRALGDDGHRMLGAENGLEGIEIACRQLPDLILCDVKMDKLDGYGTLEALRKDRATSTIPFILMTGQADHAGMRQGMELGADDYLAKPFTVPELRAAVRARLKKQVLIREQAEKRLENLRTNISCALPHELRTPLNGILGFSEMIVTEIDNLPRDEIVTMANAIHESATRLNRMIENTLLYAQIELAAGDQAKLQALQRGRVGNASTVLERVARARAEASNRLDDLRLELTSAGVAMGEDSLARLADELVDNAFKFSNPPTLVRVGLTVEDRWVILKVTDGGRGIRPEHLAETGAYMQFERRFYEQQGSGLGLAIAKRLAEIHDGNLSVRSEVGVGTEVTVALPRLRED